MNYGIVRQRLDDTYDAEVQSCWGGSRKVPGWFPSAEAAKNYLINFEFLAPRNVKIIPTEDKDGRREDS